LRELQISVTGVLLGVVQFFRVECFNLLVGGGSELLGGSEKGDLTIDILQGTKVQKE